MAFMDGVVTCVLGLIDTGITSYSNIKVAEATERSEGYEYC
jgi:hypothetical protein